MRQHILYNNNTLHVCSYTIMYSLLVLNGSLLLLLLLLSGLLWRCWLGQQCKGFLDLVVEVGSISEKLLEVDSLLVKEHTCQTWGVLLSVTLSDHSEDAVSDELGLGFTFKLVELVQVAVWELEHDRSWCVGSLAWLVGTKVDLMVGSHWSLILMWLVLVVSSTTSSSASISTSSSSVSSASTSSSSVIPTVLLVTTCVLVVSIHLVPMFD